MRDGEGSDFWRHTSEGHGMKGKAESWAAGGSVGQGVQLLGCTWNGVLITGVTAFWQTSGKPLMKG